MLMKRLVPIGVCLLVGLLAMAGVRAQNEEADDGFKPLFNGVNLVGWDTTNGHGKDWKAENGELVVTGRTTGYARNLHTARMYRDFELSLDFLLAEGGNSGVHIRLNDDGTDALEIQLLDDYAEKHANLKEWQYCGSLYAMAAPSQRVSKPAGEWQSMQVHLEGQHLTITLNGTQIVDTSLDLYIDGEEIPKARIEALKRESGYIGLQNYGDPVRFRNVKIRDLSAN